MSWRIYIPPFVHIKSPRLYIIPQVAHKTSDFRCRSLSGHVSTIVVTTVSIKVNWVPRPRVRSIEKNRHDQTGDKGNLATASGYTTNAKPAPI